MTFSRAGEAMDKQPGKRQRDGQQYPAPQPAREKYPHAEVPFFRYAKPALPRPASIPNPWPMDRSASARQLPARYAPLFTASLPAVRRCNHHVGGADGISLPAGFRMIGRLEKHTRGRGDGALPCAEFSEALPDAPPAGYPGLFRLADVLPMVPRAP